MEENSKFDKKSIKTVLGRKANFGELAKDCVAFANANGGVLHVCVENDSRNGKNGELKTIGGRRYRKYALP